MNFELESVPFMASFMTFWPVAWIFWALATVIVHLAFGAAVLVDARQLRSDGALSFVGPVIWTLAVVIGGVVIAGVYWLIHHSAINRR